MRIKSFMLVAVLSTAILCSTGLVSAQSVDNSALIAQLQAQIASLTAQIQALQAQLAARGGSTSTAFCHTFDRNLKIEDEGNEVASLQNLLAKEGFNVQGEDGFGERTASAVVELQEKYSSEILTPNGLQHGTGYVGRSTRAKLNKLYECGPNVINPQSTPVTPIVIEDKIPVPDNNRSYCTIQLPSTPSDLAAHNQPRLFNINFGVSVNSPVPPQYVRTGSAVVGSASDYWNVVAVPWCDDHTKSHLKNADNSESPIIIEMQNLGGSWRTSASLQMGYISSDAVVGLVRDDTMLDGFNYPASNKGGNSHVMLYNVPAGSYDLYLYNKTGNPSQYGDYTITVGGRSYGNKRTTDDLGSERSSSWEEGNQYVKFTIEINAEEKVEILIQPHKGALHDAQIGGLQLAPAGTPTVSPVVVYQPQQQTGATEQVKCVFNGSNNQEKCWGDYASPTVGVPTSFTCSGVSACVVTVQGSVGTPMTWGSSCGGSANTKIDGQNEYANFSCGVIPPSLPFIQIISPNGGEAYGNDGGQIAVNWYTSNVPSDFKFDVVRLRGYPNGGEYILATNVLNDGQEVITIPSNVPVGAYTLEIKSYLNNVLVFDSSDSYFKIYSNSTQPSITVLSPNGGESWQKGTTQTIKWQDNRIYPPCMPGSTSPECLPRTYDLKLVSYYPPCTGTICPAYAIHQPYTIAKDISGNSYQWGVGKIMDLYDALAPDGPYTVQVCQSGTSTCDSSDSYFKIYSQSTQPSIAVLSPNGGEAIQKGSTYRIKWDSTGVSQVYLKLRKGSDTYYGNEGAISGVISNQGYFDWTVPTTIPDGSDYGVTVVQSGGNGFDISDRNFTINSAIGLPLISITVLSPNGGESWQQGTMQTIRWDNGVRTGGEVSLYYPAVDIFLVTYVDNTCTTQASPCPVIDPIRYTIAKNVYSGQWGNYEWSVGKTFNGNVGPGAFTVQVCNAGTNTCDSSDSYFKITSVTTGNHPPEIVSASSYAGAIQVGQSVSFGWNAKDADNDDLAWSIQWGDGSGQGSASTGCGNFGKGWSFTTSHAWANPGTYKVAVTVSDCARASASSVTYITVGVSSDSLLKVLSPNGGESWQKGTMQTINWQDLTKNPTFAPVSYDLKLVPYYPPCTGTICPAIAYREPYPIANSVSGNSYSWGVGKIMDLYDALAPDGPYTVQVCQSGTTTCDSSDSYFKIYSISTQPSITSIAPSSGPAGSTVALYGTGFKLTSRVNIAYGSAPVTSVDSSGTKLNFVVPATTVLGSYKVSVTNNDGTPESNTVVFTVTSATTQPSITVLSPNGGESWQQGTMQTIRWDNGVRTGGEVSLYYPAVDIFLVTYVDNTCTTQASPCPVIDPIRYTIAKNVYSGQWGNYEWSVGKTFNGNVGPGAFTVQVCNAGTNTCDSSDSYFKIIESTVSSTQITQDQWLASISSAIAKIAAEIQKMLNK